MRRFGFKGGAPLTMFSISPAYNGHSTWDLATQGALQIDTPGSWVISPLGAFLLMRLSLWGPGGSTGASGTASASRDGQPGVASSFGGYTGSPMVANPGAATPGWSTVVDSQADAVGGTASGGDTNTTGNAGGGTTQAGSSVTAGRGAAPAISGGSATDRPSTNVNGNGVPGLPGNAPGGGASGSARKFLDPINNAQRYSASRGGGAGARCIKTFGEGVLLQAGAAGEVSGSILSVGGKGASGRALFEAV
jgi:hypothetical protein